MKLNSETLIFIEQMHQEHKKIVLVTGVFDILHRAHTLFLKKAKAVGDVLLVGLESDIRVRQIKGEGRPINVQDQRLTTIKKVASVDHAFILPESFSKKEDHLALLQLVKPAVLAVSSHTKHIEAKAQLMKEVGGELQVVMEYDPSVSTTKLLSDRHPGM